MKKIFSILLIFIYLVSVTGVTLNAHYCGGTLKSVTFVDKEEAGCCGSKKKSKNCCEDKTLKIKVEKEQNLVKTWNNFLFLSTALHTVPQLYLTANPLFIAVQDEIIPEVHPPPLIAKHRLHLLHCVFLI